MIKSFFSMIDTRIYLIIGIIFFYLILRKKKLNNLGFSISKKKEHLSQSLKYLDKLYIDNLFTTILYVLCYFIGTIIPLVVFRLLFLNKSTLYNTHSFPIKSLTITLNQIGVVVSFILLLVIFLVLYTMILDLFFFPHLLKIHLFFYKKDFYYEVEYYLSEKALRELSSKIYLFMFNISQFRIMNDYDDPHLFSDSMLIYENPKVVAWSYFLVKLAKKSKIIYYFVILLREISRRIYYHRIEYSLINKIPYIIYVFFIVHDLMLLKIQYTTYGFIPIYSLIALLRIFKFYSGKLVSRDSSLMQYLYKNQINYTKQRPLLHHNPDLFISSMQSSPQYYIILNNILNGDLSDYIKNDFNYRTYLKSPKGLLYKKAYQARTNRYFMLVSYGIIIAFLIYYNMRNDLIVIVLDISLNLTTILLPIFLITSYFGIRAFYSPLDNFDNHLELYVYKKHYIKIFWALILSSLGLFLLLIIKAN